MNRQELIFSILSIMSEKFRNGFFNENILTVDILTYDRPVKSLIAFDKRFQNAPVSDRVFMVVFDTGKIIHSNYLDLSVLTSIWFNIK